MKRNSFTGILTQIILGLIIILGILFLLTHDIEVFFSLLYSPYSFLLMVVIILEYVILKGRDRSRIYKLEIQRLKLKRMKDADFHKRLEKEIHEIQASLDDSEMHQGIHDMLDKILKSLKEL
ncbi:hypothetical protein JW926_06645 [Candidatus Sumerlaeota bacterium]|nr:hypothetical protein [Candidatus Sumerlaeota bacterium]